MMRDTRLEEFLNILKLPARPAGPNEEVFRILKEPRNVRRILKELYGIEKFDKICSRKVNPYSTIKLEVAAGQDHFSLYAKVAGMKCLKECLGIELSNMLTERKLPYLLCEDVVITEDIGDTLDEWIDYIKESEGYAYNYGMLEEFSKPIGLGDRCSQNIVVRDNKELWHIDFEWSFAYVSRTDPMLSRYRPLSKHSKAKKQGTKDAKIIVKENLENNLSRLKKILQCLNETAYLSIRGHELPMHDPKDILINYSGANGWKSIEKELKGIKY